MKHIFILSAFLLAITSCVTQKTLREPEIVSVLAINSKGDTIQVSTDYLQREFNQNPYNYSNWRFYWDNNWYWGNGWFNYYDPYWMYRIPYQNRIIIQPRPKVSTPRYVPRHFDNRPNPPIIREPRRNNRQQVVPPNRGRSNVQPPQSYPKQQPQQRREVVPQQRRGSVQQRIPNNNQPLRRIDN